MIMDLLQIISILSGRLIRPKVPDGQYQVAGVPFYSQRLDHSNFLAEGFSSLSEANYWSERICGLACFRMVLGAFRPSQSVNLKQLLDRGLEIGAYDEDKGWLHQGLVRMANDYRLPARRQSIGRYLGRIAQNLAAGNLVIASVSVGFAKGSGGHLVVIFGATVKDGKVIELEVHHPSSDPSYQWPNYRVNAEKFLEAFHKRGNIIIFKKKAVP